MSLAAYPDDLPYQPTLETFELSKPYGASIETEMEDGTLVQRAITLLKWTQLRYRLIFKTEAQVATFASFLENDLQKNSLHFNMPVWVPGANYPTREVYISGDPPYTLTPLGGPQWACAFSLNVREWLGS